MLMMVSTIVSNQLSTFPASQGSMVSTSTCLSATPVGESAAMGFVGLGVLCATPVGAVGFVGLGVLGGSRLGLVVLPRSAYISACIAAIPAIILFISLICDDRDDRDDSDDSDRGDCRGCSDSDDAGDSSPLPFPADRGGRGFPADDRRDSDKGSSPSPFPAVPCGRGDRDDQPSPVVAPALGINDSSPVTYSCRSLRPRRLG